MQIFLSVTHWVHCCCFWCCCCLYSWWLGTDCSERRLPFKRVEKRLAGAGGHLVTELLLASMQMSIVMAIVLHYNLPGQQAVAKRCWLVAQTPWNNANMINSLIDAVLLRGQGNVPAMLPLMSENSPISNGDRCAFLSAMILLCR